jgi:hypothetical protein
MSFILFGRSSFSDAVRTFSGYPPLRLLIVSLLRLFDEFTARWRLPTECGMPFYVSRGLVSATGGL